MNEQPQNQQVEKVPVDQALATVASAVKQLKLTLDEHVILQRCLQSLDELVKENTTPAPSVDRIEKAPRVMPTPRKTEKNLE